LEGGVREPTIAWWPGRIEMDSACDAIAGTIDLLPTFVSLAGGKLHDNVRIDGRDISQVLLGETTESPHDAWYYYQNTQLQAVRSGPWKLAIRPQSLGMGMKERPEDLRVPGVRLYNLDAEIGEVTNVAKQHPLVVDRLQKLVHEMIADIGSGKPGPGVRPAGVVENPVMLYPTQPRRRVARPTAKKIDWEKIKLGDAYATRSAPAIAGKPFSITCTIDAEAPHGVILAHGGSAVGYALYAIEGRIVFAVRHSSTEIQRIASPTVSRGSTRILASLNADGVLSLSLNGAVAVTARSRGLLANHPQEDFCLGHDNRNPLDDQAPRQRFNAKVSSAKVVVGEKRE